MLIRCVNFIIYSFLFNTLPSSEIELQSSVSYQFSHTHFSIVLEERNVAEYSVEIRPHVDLAPPSLKVGHFDVSNERMPFETYSNENRT